ncbi:hypothetical protein [uncultured Butyricimonas sp.]|uniref:hypothetical protein n=1 Tax=uncultured Butyricimonas sp. TaxID=1268785 RepID=UPI0026DB6E54|nr:hypothetical protein [uncultured Butyricimonas sp.]
MKLKEFSTRGRKALKGIATITFSKSGCIGLNQKAVEAMGVKSGDKLIFFQDEENPTDWYLQVAQDKGAELRLGSGTSGGLFCNFAFVVQEVFDSTKTKDRAKFQISTQAENGMYAIITKNEI